VEKMVSSYNARKQQMGFNSAFKGLMLVKVRLYTTKNYEIKLESGLN
jgi:hypothetical protein